MTDGKTIFKLNHDIIENTIELEKKFSSHFLIKNYDNEIQEFFDDVGKEHQRLLAYLSTLFEDSVFITTATCMGQDPLALSYNDSNTVYTFDKQCQLSEEQQQNKWKSRKIQFNQLNLWNAYVRKQWKDTLLSASIIMIDLDPHDGYLEYELYSWLKRNKYAGIIIFDDIHYFEGMKANFWSKIPESEKHDITHLGHFSGTGLIYFPEYATFSFEIN